MCIWVCRTRTVFGRQRCNDGICACCLLRAWRMSELCANSSHESLYCCRGKKTTLLCTGTYVKSKAFVLKPGKSSYPLPPEKTTFSARHALQSARIVPRRRPMCPAGLPRARVLGVLPKSARTKRKVGKSTNI